MSAAAFLQELRDAGVQVTLDGDTLRVSAPAGALRVEQRDRLKALKPELVAFLRLGTQLRTRSRALIPLQPHGARTPIYAVAGHNGDVFAYRALADALGTDQPFYGLQPPGYEEGTLPLARVEALAEHFAEQIAAFQPTGACVVAGFCAGGATAFELACRLRRRGLDVQRLVLFGAPFSPWYRSVPQAWARARHVVARVRYHARALKSLHVRDSVGYSRVLLAQVRADLRRDPVPTDPLLIRRHGVETATMQAVRHYAPGRFDGHLDIMVPAESWTRLPAQLLRWGDHAASSAVYAGPDGCVSDTMLLPAYAPAFAALVVASVPRQV